MIAVGNRVFLRGGNHPFLRCWELCHAVPFHCRQLWKQCDINAIHAPWCDHANPWPKPHARCSGHHGSSSDDASAMMVTMMMMMMIIIIITIRIISIIMIILIIAILLWLWCFETVTSERIRPSQASHRLGNSWLPNFQWTTSPL